MRKGAEEARALAMAAREDSGDAHVLVCTCACLHCCLWFLHFKNSDDGEPIRSLRVACTRPVEIRTSRHAVGTPELQLCQDETSHKGLFRLRGRFRSDLLGQVTCRYLSALKLRAELEALHSFDDGAECDIKKSSFSVVHPEQQPALLAAYS